jgi:hypothetical protein
MIAARRMRSTFDQATLANRVPMTAIDSPNPALWQDRQSTELDGSIRSCYLGNQGRTRRSDHTDINSQGGEPRFHRARLRVLDMKTKKLKTLRCSSRRMYTLGPFDKEGN